MALVVGVIFVTIFAWAWAVRRPAPTAPTSAEPHPVTYAAIGASDVVGVGANDPQNESWVNALHAKMPAGSKLVRLGRSGITLHEALAVEVPQAVAAQPDVITLWNCVNDATQGVLLASYVDDLKAALSRLTGGTKAHIYLLNMPDISLLSQGDAQQRALIQGGVAQWNAAIAATASAYPGRVTVVGLFPVSEEVLRHPEYISPDHFHPSTTGYRRAYFHTKSPLSWLRSR